jgi:pimeloyl-ACP methyl ester carboxylesterase
MGTDIDVVLDDGRTLHAYDASADGAAGGVPVLWHHGTPNVGSPPVPLLPAAAERGLRWVSYDRPGYGGSTRRPGRDLASAAQDAAAVADALGIEQFAVMGHSGGANHALACAALLPDRVLAIVWGSGLAPYDAAGLDWFAGVSPAGTAELRAAADGPEALERLLATSEFDPEQFTPADHAALAGEWSWLGTVAGQGLANGLGGMVDDDVAYVTPWGFDAGPVRPPMLLLHGGQDRMVPSAHSEWVARRNPSAELWLRPDEGHVSVLRHAVPALDWLADRVGSR